MPDPITPIPDALNASADLHFTAHELEVVIGEKSLTAREYAQLEEIVVRMRNLKSRINLRTEVRT